MSGRYLSLAEREEIALLLVQGHGVCEIARRLGRAPLTISGEIQRNAATLSGMPSRRRAVPRLPRSRPTTRYAAGPRTG
ncbi:helix-turn-helix domain-containing protein [Sphingomonas glacialis]|uniref:Helix-turn-helix domain-containing protein n=1 Tax=Sphingomonas glacialis TaxID=658225 RepID=A0A502FSH3_9SPHN|nr:helix-turn-helix domain-containing protein [Sphingomonas glacialis]